MILLTFANYFFERSINRPLFIIIVVVVVVIVATKMYYLLHVVHKRLGIFVRSLRYLRRALEVSHTIKYGASFDPIRGYEPLLTSLQFRINSVSSFRLLLDDRTPTELYLERMAID